LHGNILNYNAQMVKQSAGGRQPRWNERHELDGAERSRNNETVPLGAFLRYQRGPQRLRLCEARQGSERLLNATMSD